MRERKKGLNRISNVNIIEISSYQKPIESPVVRYRIKKNIFTYLISGIGEACA